MSRVIVSTERFRRAYHRLDAPQQTLVDDALQRLGAYLETGHASIGLGIKQLHPGVFEVRVGLALRVVYVKEGEHIVLALLGNHDDVRRFLKRQ